MQFYSQKYRQENKWVVLKTTIAYSKIIHILKIKDIKNEVETRQKSDKLLEVTKWPLSSNSKSQSKTSWYETKMNKQLNTTLINN